MSKTQGRELSDQELLRYSRQIMLPDFDIAGQEHLLNTTMAIVGLGGLGSPAALYLAAAGTGKLILIDHDEVELSNLQRQIAHRVASVGETKVASAATAIQATNPDIQVQTHPAKLVAENIAQVLQGADVVLDCSDNYAVRYLLNDYCWDQGLPLVSGAAIRWEGQITVFDGRQQESPCYRCLHPSAEGEDLNCATNGVMAPVVGTIGTLQALEAIKVATGVGEPSIGRLTHFDAKYFEFRSLRLTPRTGCRCRSE